MTLDEFETLVLSQKPADRAWRPVTDYSFEARAEIEGKHPQLIAEVFCPSIVLDYGAGFGHLVRLLRASGVNAFAYEPFVELHQDAGPNLRDVPGPMEFDLVICREVLEHLTVLHIRQTVETLCRYSSKFVYVTTRFSSEADLLTVATSDELDPTHISICSKDLIRLMFVLEGFKRRDDLEARMDWMHKGRCLVYERAV